MSQAAQLAMSLLLDRQQPCARWLEEIAQVAVAAVVWSGSLLKIIPYGDQALSANGATWTPDLTWRYSLGDSDFIDFSANGQGGSDPVKRLVALGALADSVDLRAALYVCAAAPVAALVLTLLLPPTRVRGRLEPEIAMP